MTAGPRVVMVGAEWPGDVPGGLNRYLAELATSLRARGVDAVPVVLGDAVGAPAYVVAAGEANGGVAARVRAMYRATRVALRDGGVLDAHFAFYALLPVLGTRRRRRVVVHFQGPWAEESRVSGDGALSIAVKRRVERTVYRRASRFVTLSEAFASVLASDYGVSRDRVSVIPPGVDLTKFAPGDRDAARAELNLPADAFVVACVRRLDPRMGLDTLLDAWGRVQHARPDARLLIAGEGAEREALERKARSLPEPNHVEFLGRVDETSLVRLYQAADCSVVPTRALEGFGLVVLESLACGTPSIVTDSGGLPESVAELDSTLVVPAGDPGALAARLLAGAGGDLPAPGACRAHAEKFSWDVIAERHVHLYDEVGRRRPRVVFLDHTAQASGGELALARLLPALDVDAHVILAEDGPIADRLRDGGATVEVLPLAERVRGMPRDRAVGPASALGAMAMARYSLQLAKRIRALDADVVHANSLKAAVYGGAAARRARVPMVWHLRDQLTDDYLGRRSRLLMRLVARTLPAAVIANSESTLGTVALPKRVHRAAVPSPVDITPVARPPVREDFTVGIVGRLTPWKGQHLFLEAFAKAFPDGGERAVVVGGALFGESDYERELHSHADRLALTDRVTFRGHVNDVGAEYAQMDVLVHASTLPEPFGNVVVEALAAGVPVVAANAGGPAELLTDGVDGLLYPIGDSDALAARLRQLREDPALRERLARHGAARADAFRAENIAPRVEEIYRLVLGEKR